MKAVRIPKQVLARLSANSSGCNAEYSMTLKRSFNNEEMPALWYLSVNSPLMTAGSFGVYETMKAYMNTDSAHYKIQIPCEQDVAIMNNFRGFFGKRKEEKEGVEAKKEDDLQEEEEADEENDDNDDNGDDGDLLMPVIEWIGGVIPRLAAEMK